MPVVVITEVGDLDPRPGIAILEQNGFEVVVLEHGLPADAAALPARAADAVAAIVGFAPFGPNELALFPSLQLVCTTSTGVDMVDLVAAGERNVAVVGLGGVATQEVAVHALALILAALRELPAGRAVVTRGGWAIDLDVVPRPVGELVLGLVGVRSDRPRDRKNCAAVVCPHPRHRSLRDRNGPRRRTRVDRPAGLGIRRRLAAPAGG